ncbi:hypothetical protein [Mucilaginibacter celer]|uniref:Uncharacterized protein n=1 Tax=Mucilaginibacter celer TaxID=2305508 RepID=A0A494VXC6_9SPHI|nr:hypothetical protein [Mucilaginibacter celer]AYL98120.1 hypothetical protein HYN43_023785 [Mucilaginibacter celer]
MKAQIKDIDVYFGCSAILGVKSWSTIIRYHQYQLHFDFDESELSNNNILKPKIDQKLMVHVVEHVLEHINAIKLKATALFTELHSQVYGPKSLSDDKGYFQPENIKLKKVSDIGGDGAGLVPHFEYDVHYCLESEIDILIDVYYTYRARFSNYNGLTLIGAWRTG